MQLPGVGEEAIKLTWHDPCSTIDKRAVESALAVCAPQMVRIVQILHSGGLGIRQGDPMTAVLMKQTI